MRILHTADWHLGHELAGWPREAEQRRVLDEIAALARQHAVDALIIAGDVFDHQNPSAAMYRQLFEFFDRLATDSDITVVVIAGNHDSVGRIEAPRPLLQRANVHAVGSLLMRGDAVDLQRHLIAVRRGGETIGHVLAIPYLRPADLPGFAAFDAAPEAGAEAGVRRLYVSALQAARAQIGDLPLVATGHLHVRGASLSESLSERRILIGGEHAVPASVFGDDADYVALGHLHRAQSLGKRIKGKGAATGDHVRYAGSPLPLSAIERDYEHGVSLIELAPRRLTLSHLPLTRPVPFLRVPATGRLLLDEVEAALDALSLDAEKPQGEWPFVHVFVRIDGPQPGLRSRLDEICARFPVRLAAVDIARPELPADARRAEPLRQLRELSPQELFTRAFTERHGTPPDAEHIARFHRLLDEAAG